MIECFQCKQSFLSYNDNLLQFNAACSNTRCPENFQSFECGVFKPNTKRISGKVWEHKGLSETFANISWDTLWYLTKTAVTAAPIKVVLSPRKNYDNV